MTSLPTRDDTLLGVCEGLGEELGVPAIALRVALAVLVLVAPGTAIALYLGMGAALLAGRLIWPAASAPAAEPPAAPVAVNDDADALPRAA